MSVIWNIWKCHEIKSGLGKWGTVGLTSYERQVHDQVVESDVN